MQSDTLHTPQLVHFTTALCLHANVQAPDFNFRIFMARLSKPIHVPNVKDIYFFYCNIIEWHGGAMVSTATSHQEDLGFEPDGGL